MKTILALGIGVLGGWMLHAEYKKRTGGCKCQKNNGSPVPENGVPTAPSNTQLGNATVVGDASTMQASFIGNMQYPTDRVTSNVAKRWGMRQNSFDGLDGGQTFI